MRKGTYKRLETIKKRDVMKEFEGTFEVHGFLMINKEPADKFYSVTHIKSGGAYIHGLTLKQARKLVKQTMDFTCWKAKDWKELQSKCHSRRWKGKLTRAIETALENT